MFKKQSVRKVGPACQRRTHGGENQVKYKLDGVAVWVKEIKPGQAIVPSSAWYARVRGHDGKTVVVKLCRDKSAAETMLRDLQKHADRVNAGLEAPRANTKESCGELVERYLVEKVDGGITGKHRGVLYQKITEAINWFEWKNLDGIRRGATSDNLARWIAKLPGASATRLGRIVALRGFLRWLNDSNLLPVMPRIKPVAAKSEYPKRVLTDDELLRLFNAAPWKRALFYKLALSTLTRRGALMKVTAHDFNNLDGDAPSLTLKAEHSKTRRAQVVPILQCLVPDIKRLVAEMGDAVCLFEIAGLKNTSTAFWYDLKKAGIPAITADGAATMHALRHTGATQLVKAGTSLLVIQRLGGWKNLKMLSEVYSHLEPEDARITISAVFGGIIH